MGLKFPIQHGGAGRLNTNVNLGGGPKKVYEHWECAEVSEIFDFPLCLPLFGLDSPSGSKGEWVPKAYLSTMWTLSPRNPRSFLRSVIIFLHGEEKSTQVIWGGSLGKRSEEDTWCATWASEILQNLFWFVEKGEVDGEIYQILDTPRTFLYEMGILCHYKS